MLTTIAALRVTQLTKCCDPSSYHHAAGLGAITTVKDDLAGADDDECNNTMNFRVLGLREYCDYACYQGNCPELGI